MEAGDVYQPARQRITELVQSLTEEELDTLVPATPLWRVRDLVAHLAGAATDVKNGVLEGAATEPWTAKQVADRKGHSLAQLLDEWNEVAPALEADLPIPQLAFDILTHEWDIRGAVDKPGNRGLEEIDWVAQQVTGFIGGRIRKRELPALRINAGTDEWLLGDGDPEATLNTETFELFRLGFGRRSEAQVRGYDWTGAGPDPYLPVVSVFPFATSDVTEP
ncbi:MAG: hypothetical protein QOF60_2875 [Actinomycetota bacterium]|jgi:uncharacterized protein (TIGR03083 family)|nr:hypothetical protein [Actinomycetota bacterium]